MNRPTPQPQQAKTGHVQLEAARLNQVAHQAPLAVVRGASVNFGNS